MPLRRNIVPLVICVAVMVGAHRILAQPQGGQGVQAGPLTTEQRVAPAGNSNGNAGAVAQYIAGIDAMEQGQYAAAVKDLAEASAADADNPDYVRAKGVAKVLAEDFPSAVTDLQRAMRIRNGNDREAKLWLAAAYRMSGDWEKGSLNFTYGGDIPNDYAFFVYDTMASDYANSRYNHTHYDKALQRQVHVDQPIKTHFIDAAKMYAQRHKAQGPQATEALLERVKASFAASDWASMIGDLRVLREQSPDDAQVRGYWAAALLGVGDALDARTEFTHALSLSPLWADGYAARARAAAMIGDGRRASADLQTATKLGWKDLKSLQGQIDQLLSDKAPDDASAQFVRAISADTSFADLVHAAIKLRRWANNKRLRYDEAYQDRIGALAIAAHDQPASPDPPDLLGWFMYSNCDVPVLWDGPRSNGVHVRPQSPAERTGELQRAIGYADAANKIDPQRGGPFATKGWALYVLQRRGDSENVADQGLQIAPQNVPLLDLKSQLLIDAAAEMEAHAAALRRPRVESHTEQRADGEYRVTTTYPPTADALAEAKELEAKAAALREQAARLQSQADKVKTDVVPGLIKQSEASLKNNDAATARKTLQQAYAYWPGAPGLMEHLADACQRMDDAPWQRIYSLLATSMRETTASSDLKTAWDAITRTTWQAASEALTHAASMDPCDARVYIYRSAADGAWASADPAAFQHDCLAALALEEARARQMGTTVSGPAVNLAVDMITPRDVALSMLLRNRLAESMIAAGQNQKATDILAPNFVMERRLSGKRLVDPLSAILIPDPKANEIPQSPCLATVLSYSHLAMGKAYLALGKKTEAAEEYRKVSAYLANWPLTVEGRETLYVPEAWAQLGLAKLAYAAKDYEKAYQIMIQSGGWPGNLPDDLKQQIKQVSDQVMAARQGAAQQSIQQQFDAQAHMTPQQRRIQSLQYDLQQLQQQRDNLAKAKDDSSTTAQGKTAIENSISQLDQMIEDRKKAIEKAQTTPSQQP